MMVKAYARFLSLCAFNRQEIEINKHKLRQACEHLGITKEQVLWAAEEWIPQNYDLKLAGMSKLIGIYIREFLQIMDLTLEKSAGRKIIYGTVPAPVPLFLSLKDSGNGILYAGAPDYIFMIVLNSFFNWGSAGLASIEAEGFTPACRHCALNKMRAHLFHQKYIPEPDLVWSWGTACDEAVKTGEFMQCRYGHKWSSVFTKIPHDTCRDDQVPDQERVTYLARQIKDAVNTIAERCLVPLSPGALSRAMLSWTQITAKIYYLNTLAGHADPVPLGGNELALVNALQLVPLNTGLESVKEAIDTLTAAVKERIREKKGILPPGAPRLGCYLVPFCQPRLVQSYQSCGVALTLNTAMLGGTLWTHLRSRGTSFREDIPAAGPYEILAGQWLRLPLFNNIFYEAAAITRLLVRYQCDGLILGLFAADRWLGAHQKLLKRILEETTAKPIFYLEADFWDERFNDQARITSQIETISALLTPES